MNDTNDDENSMDSPIIRRPNKNSKKFINESTNDVSGSERNESNSDETGDEESDSVGSESGDEESGEDESGEDESGEDESEKDESREDEVRTERVKAKNNTIDLSDNETGDDDDDDRSDNSDEESEEKSELSEEESDVEKVQKRVPPTINETISDSEQTNPVVTNNMSYRNRDTSPVIIDSTDETPDKSESDSHEDSEQGDQHSIHTPTKKIEESKDYDVINDTNEFDDVSPKKSNNSLTDELPDIYDNIQPAVIKKSMRPIQNSTINDFENYSPQRNVINRLSEEIPDIIDNSPAVVSKQPMRPIHNLIRNSDPEIIELSDTDPSTPVKLMNPSHKAITGLLSLSKSAVKGDQRMLAGWSPNYENYTPNTINRLKLEKAKLRVKNEPTERKLQMLDIENTETSSKLATALNSNPSKLDKKDLRAQVAQGLNKQQTNRNYSYEDKLKSITDPMFESLDQKPDPEQNFDDFVNPKGLKVKLLPHQCYSMQWLKWREGEYPHGAILADDMGLGKTLTVLSYLKITKDIYEKRQKEKRQEQDDDDEEEEDDEPKQSDDENFDERKYLKKIKSKNKSKNRLREEVTSKRLKTLIVLPASLLHQWQGEIASKFEKNVFKIHVYHEANRKKHSYNLDDNDIVFTTYEIISREVTVPDKEGHVAKSDSPLVNIKWKRIILDEAHRIKNHSTKANKAMCMLKAKYRIAITGTPVHNSLNDLYSLVKFIHFEPLDDFGLWKYLFASETFSTKAKSSSIEREKRVGFWLKFLSDYLILRRTKKDKFTGTDKCIVDLPEKRIEEVRFKLNPGENTIYQQIFKESKDKVNKFLDNQQNKIIGKQYGGNGSNVSEIFVYLLRLRQACCHMSLLSECLDTNELKNQQFEQEGVEGLMDNMTLNDKSSLSTDLSTINDIKTENLAECLERSYMSSKIGKSVSMILNILKEFPDDKLIVVSQWTTVLAIVGSHLKKQDIEYCEIKGDVMLFKRNEIVESFNDKSNTNLKVMLLSLTAGGVGLNLVGANRMFLLDIHWNPALEAQCADRIYRVGQKKNVTIYKLLCEETIEERIQQIQKFKIEIAEKVCRSGAESTAIPGVPGNAKLTTKDLKLLFQEF